MNIPFEQLDYQYKVEFDTDNLVFQSTIELDQEGRLFSIFKEGENQYICLEKSGFHPNDFGTLKVMTSEDLEEFKKNTDYVAVN